MAVYTVYNTETEDTMNVANVFSARIPPGAKVLYFYVSVHPGVYTQAELARETGVTAQSVNAHVKTLRECGLMRTESVPGSRRYLYETVAPHN